jgi:HAD superfamily hydrolase (TIGR01458 family)
MQAVLFDLDGVIYQAGAPIPGAAAAVQWFRDREVPHLFLTNTSSRPRRRIASRLAGMGLDIPFAQIFTPAIAANAWLRDNGAKSAAFFLRPETLEDFPDVAALTDDQESGADAVVIGDLGEGWDFRRLNHAFRLLMAEPRPRLVALGMTRYWHAGDGLRLDTAPFVAALREASGAQPVVLGKPAQPFFAAALGLLGSPAEQTLMVGDDIRGDIEGAQGSGIRGVLVRTGKFRPRDLESGVTPQAVLGSVAELPAWWESEA